MQKKIISAGIDIGSSKVAVCVGTQSEDGVDILGISKAENSGSRKGVVIDIEETVSAISSALEEAEKMIGLQIENAVVGVSGAHIESEISHGVIAIGKSDGEISENDMLRAIDASKAIPNQPNREILHVIPKTFIVDGQNGIINPVGMSGIRLEVDTNIISGSISAIKNVVMSANQSGIGIDELVFSPLATSKFLLGKQQKEIGSAIVDIGAGTTSFAVFEEGDLVHCGVIPIGSSHITNDIAIGLRTNINLAEILKIKYGYASPDNIDEKEEIDLKKIDSNESGQVSVKYITEIIEARLNELFILVKDELGSVNREGMLPAGISLTGGGSKLAGISQLAKDIFRLPVEIGKSDLKLVGVVDNLSDPVYATSAGLMLWGLNSVNHSKNRIIDSTQLTSIFDKVRKSFRHFLP
ncbi:MAG: cell division protein FtsA [Candidatus Berkelbacteria bacterium Athens1014_28]|uniref:Cell division protein FtsA n=1 Tax=Candidatus Berkelbacteria bacterium Athens1014_28 TaxID=2017145 RepID=A0A554LN07_9BACT|nr:MAG: cell division protein FtsA [Candidatus Berkelbacteria bacterium Athens1014_28]